MEIYNGIVTGYEYTTNRDSEREVIMLQVSLSEDDDVQSVQLYSEAGNTYIPPIDSNVIVIEITPSFKIAIASDDGFDPETLDEGERLLYSLDEDGDHRTEIWLQNEGTIEIKSLVPMEGDDNPPEAVVTITLANDASFRVENDEGYISLANNGEIRLDTSGNVVINSGDVSAVKYTELKSAFDQLRSDLNSHIAHWNTFATNYVPGSSTVQGTPPTATSSSTSSADMSDAEVPSIKVP